MSGTEEAFLHDIVHDKTMLTHYLGSMSVSDEIGTILGMLMSSLLISLNNIVSSFEVAFAGLSLAFFLVILIKTDGLSIDEETHAIANARKLLFAEISAAFLFFILIFGLFSERGEMVYQYAFTNLGVGLESLGLIYLGAKLFSVIGSRLSHLIENKITTHMALLLSGFLQVIAFAILTTNSSVLVIISLCIFFFSENIFRNIRSSFVLKNSHHQRRATNLSLISFGSSAILIFSKLLIGWTLDVKFLYAIIFVVALKIIAIIFIINRTNSDKRLAL